jgi:hypothetical protein
MARINTKPCTQGPRHTWTFVKNASVGSLTHTARGSVGRFTLKGLYRCACGATKYGAHDPNQGGDLRGLIGELSNVEGGA